MGTATRLKTLALRAVAISATVVTTWAHVVVEAQRDRGINQPGAVGNRPAAATPAGYGGSARQVRAVTDPGVNQPGAVGNRGVDPGVNQPGAAGNVGRDPGVNQPGAAGNRR
jgi:hypothetical protein